MSKRVLSILVLLALAAMLFSPPSVERSAAQQEVYVFHGSGWGHGVGMCQYGARGMAEHGFDYGQILTYYYQNTQVSAWNCPVSIRVGLLEGMSTIQLVADSGSFTLYTPDGDIPGGVINPGGTWTVAADENARFFIVKPDGTCLNGTSYGGADKPLWIRGSGDGDVLRLPQNGGRRYSHLSNSVPMELNLYGCYPCSLRVILNTWFETYIKGVAEVPGSWPQEAVKAQAVAARSFAVRSMGKHASSNYDICDEVSDQYYQGYDKEQDAGWVQAVDATAGEVLAYQGGVAQCFYSSSCGGHTDNNEDVWFGSPVPYLRGVPDPYCMDEANPYAQWTVTYTRQEMESRLNAHPSSYVGTLYSMDLSDRTAGGRVRHATFAGSAGTKTITGEQLRSYLGLRSAMVNVEEDHFDEYILMANPGDEQATALLSLNTTTGDGERVEVEMPARSRRTVHVDDYFYDAEVAADIDCDGEIVAERAMYFDYHGDTDGGSCSSGVPEAETMWYLAEGYTVGPFDTWILAYNPGDEKARVEMELLREDGYTRSLEVDVGAGCRVTVSVDALDDFSSCSLSADITSDKAVVVERAMYFESWGRRGGHVSQGSTELSFSWLFAEGYTGGDFDTWILVGNPHDMTVNARLNLYVPGGGGETLEWVDIPARSRYTFHLDDYLEDSEVAAFLECDKPVVAERAMYFDYQGKQGGTCALGSPQANGDWFLAEGYTGGDFDEYVLVSNPREDSVRVKFSFLTQDGLAEESHRTLEPHSRYTLHVDERFEADEVSLLVEERDGKGIVVERAMYFDYCGRRGGHASFGVPATSSTWYFAEGYTGS
ncbi:MAG: SpoIID/LytB domain-containing protein [Actinomycetota bacterium]|nr:SpoIID/LytB domain-containing protein [Actinomycetota bacterium]